MVTIREYRESDEEAIVALVRELNAHELAIYERMLPPERIDVAYLREIERQCAESAGRILVAETPDGAIVGYASVLTAVDSVAEGTHDETQFVYAYVSDLIVAWEWRGRGIGGRLLAECERLSQEAGRDELRITVLANNGGAHRLYRRAGFADHEVLRRKRLA
jgi:ribosomal protein S18 acetylase RimI-like enzyme